MDPDFKDIDSNGFRNSSLQPAKIVAIGDSHTYGFNVSTENSWPALLGYMLDKNVYNYGVGGYGILQYKHLLNKAFKMRPDIIIVGLYVANDLSDVCKLLETSQYWITHIDELGIKISACPLRPEKRNRQKASGKSNYQKIITGTFSDYSAIFSIVLDLYYRYTMKNGIERGEIKGSIVINEGNLQTVISNKRIRMINRNINPGSPHIQNAYDVLTKILVEANERARSDEIGLGVLLIPSRERVFYSKLTRRNYELPDVYTELALNEEKLVNKISSFLDSAGIPFVDIFPDMEKLILEGVNIYPAMDDGHPNEAGYQVYADNAGELYQKLIQ